MADPRTSPGGLVRELAGLVLPIACAGCGRWDVALCPDCRALFAGPPVRCESAAPLLPGAGASLPLPVWRLAEYAGPARGVVLAWKSAAGPALRRPLGDAARQAGARLGASPPPGAHGCELLVVPAPSGWRRRAAGRLVAAEMARAVGAGLLAAGVPARPADVVRRRAGGRHQAGLGAAGRGLNRRTTMALVAEVPPSAACLLVDDVLTTGATLAELRRVVVASGARVVGALVMAATPPVSAGRGRVE